MRILIRAYDLDYLRGTGLTIKAVARYLADAGEEVCATRAEMSLDDVRAWAPQIIISQEWATTEAAQWATTLQVPFVMLVHGPDEYRQYMPHADLVVFNTREQEDLARRDLGHTPSMVLHPPVFPADYVTDGRGACLTLIGPHPLKGLDVFLQLARLLPEERFLLVGSYPAEDFPPNVQLQPETTDMRSVYARTKLLLMPSDQETSGRVAIEAAMSGIPTVGSDLAGLREATAGLAVFVARGQRWAEVVRSVLANIDTHREAARKLAELRDPSTELAALHGRLREVVRRGRRRPTLALCLLVHNGGSTLERAVRSVSQVVDEIVIGVVERTDDESLDIARRLATHVFTFAGDTSLLLARARNRAMDRIETDWALFLEGHEWIEGAEHIQAALEITAWSIDIPVLEMPKSAETPELSFPHPRIHRRTVRFDGPDMYEDISTPYGRHSMSSGIRVRCDATPGRSTLRHTRTQARHPEQPANAGTVSERWRPVFDLCIGAYYEGKLEDGRWACQRLLSLPDVPADVRYQTRRNQVFYTPPLPALAPSTDIKEIVFDVQERWSRFNPSIAVHGDGYRVIGRSSNYTTDRWQRYRMVGDENVIRTTNYLITLDAGLSVQRAEMIDDLTDKRSLFPFPVSGYEDCRLIHHENSWYALATTRERNPAGFCEIALLELVGNAFCSLRLLSRLSEGRHEKNWMPVSTNGGLRFVYSCRPTVVQRYVDSAIGVEQELAKPAPLIADNFRGGSQGVELPEGYLFVVHEPADFEDGSRVYSHRFVLMDRGFAIIRVSLPFYFLERGVEFCAGLALRKGILTASFGLRDQQAYVASVALDEVRAILHPVV